MNDERRSDDTQFHLLDRGLAFYGTITASVSHELNNVVSIIDQTTGLLEDMIAAVERGKPISADRLEEIAGSLRKHTGRGLDIIKRLNAFAHSSDVPRCRYDINEAVTNLVELSRRLADMKRVQLTLQLGSGVPEAYGNPFFARQAMFEPIRHALANAEAGDRIDIRTGRHETNSGPEVRIEVTAHASNREQLSAPLFESLLGHAVATIAVGEEGDRVVYCFQFSGEG